MRHAVALVFSLVALSSGSSALADPPHRTIVARGVVVIHGVRQQPQRFDLAGRSATGYAAPASDARFVERVLDATRAAPF